MITYAVRAYYDGLLRAMPDLAIEVRRRHVAEDVVVATHRGFSNAMLHVRISLFGVQAFLRVPQ